MKIGDHINPQITCFKYLGFIILNDRERERDVNHRIQTGWMKWRNTWVLFVIEMYHPNLMENFFFDRTSIGPTILYKTEC